MLYYLISALLGSTLVFTFGPYYMWYIAIFAISLELYLLSKIKNLCIGFLAFNLGYFVSCVHWIAFSIDKVDAVPEFYKYLAMISTPLILSIINTTLFQLTKCFNSLRLRFSITLFLGEAVRSTMLFPWCLIGDIILETPLFYSISVLGAATTSLPFLFTCTAFYKPYSFLKKKYFIAPIILCISHLIGLYTPQSYVNHMPFIIVQPNLELNTGDNEHMAHNLMKVLSTAEHIKEHIDNDSYSVIWPESAVQFLLRKEDMIPLSAQFTNAMDKNTNFIFGADRLEQDKIFNSMILLDAKGNTQYYDKHILVPFGEYVPFRTILGDVFDKLVYSATDFTHGTDQTLFSFNGLKAIPLVCYEIAFSNYIRKFDIQNAHIIINATNDAWFGESIGPHQHMAVTRIRALEYGMPILRAANSGISAYIDNAGTIIRHTKLGQSDFIVIEEGVIKRSYTIYAKYGLYIYNITLVCLLICLFLYALQRNNCFGGIKKLS